MGHLRVLRTTTVIPAEAGIQRGQRRSAFDLRSILSHQRLPLSVTIVDTC